MYHSTGVKVSPVDGHLLREGKASLVLSEKVDYSKSWNVISDCRNLSMMTGTDFDDSSIFGLGDNEEVENKSVGQDQRLDASSHSLGLNVRSSQRSPRDNNGQDIPPKESVEHYKQMCQVINI